jgi:hypothetical protein
MNFKSVIALGFGVATLGLSLPAFADTATTLPPPELPKIIRPPVDPTTRAETDVSSHQGRNRNSSGIDVSTKQNADVPSDGNHTNQNTNTKVPESRIRNK